ncbi:MAG TPA: SDR family oxidoreductase [Candidatus Saccharimonadales bacterium]|jgi:nucleoside-diphosphate-sugar epimerase|nr:SDR family oxidoreductase [Candidatus Saccharimonadales bacterium]
MQSPPTLLLTGATGLVGSELLKLLLAARPGRRIAVLTRQRHKVVDLNLIDGVAAFHGDIVHPSLGLNDKTYAELNESIVGIVHCAANTGFGLSLTDARAVNTVGTLNLLEFAGKCPGLQKFAHLSTAYVVGKAAGHFLEGPICHQSGYCNTYQQSKHEAEELVAQAMDHLPACIFRLSSILGDSITGEVRQFNFVHQLIRLFPRNMLPMVPGAPSVTIDLIASDWATAALASLFDHGFVPGSYYHICAGPEQSLTIGEMLDSMKSLFDSHPMASRWLPIRVPELVPIARYEQFAGESHRGGDKLLIELLRVLGYFLPHLGIFQAFDNRRTMNMLELPLPSIRTCFEKVVRYCLETNWGSQPAQFS